ncbi:hypothetical protein GEMRC1_007640 [Eukaryota sp. GEM-RC1]
MQLSQVFAISALTGATSLIAVFYAAVRFKEYELLLILAFGILSPFAELVCKDDNSFDSSSGLEIMGKFLTAALCRSGLCLPIMLFHSDIIATIPLTIALSGAMLFYSSVFIFVEKVAPDNDSF